MENTAACRSDQASLSGKLLSRLLLLGLGFVPLSAAADGLQQCRGVSLDYQCVDGEPVPVARRLDAGAQAYLITVGAQSVRFEATQQSVVLSASRTVTIAGLGANCCLSHRSLPPPPAGLRSAPTQTLAPSISAYDFAVTLNAPPVCPEGAAGHACRFSVSVGAFGDAPQSDLLPLSVTASGGIGQLSLGPDCTTAGPQTQFCQVGGRVAADF